MPASEKSLLVNLVGHAAGLVIFGLFLFLFLRDRTGTRLRGSWLTIVAATLAMLWNGGSLAGLLFPSRAGLLEAISFSAVSVLPAVLLHISLGHSLPLIRVCGYILSACAVALHVSELWIPNASIHATGLLLITAGFGVLTLLATVAAFRARNQGWSRLVASMSLVLFASSFSHFGPSHEGHAWANELFFHHAGLPLAIFVLLQDYRFLFVDAFLRFVAGAAAAVIFATAAVRITGGVAPKDALHRGLDLGIFTALLIAFAMFHEWLQNWLTHVVFRRPDAAAAQRKLHDEGPEDAPQYLEWAVRQIAGFLHAEQAEVRGSLDGCGNPLPHPVSDHPLGIAEDPSWVEAIVPVHGPPGARPVFLFGRRRGGLRYLSEDYAFLSQMAGVAAQRLGEFQTREVQKLLAEAELKALQSQINPHFLFNALNTIYGSIPRTSPEARRMVRNLSDMFRYSLQEATATVPIEREIEIVRAYLDIEQLRFPERLSVAVYVSPDTAGISIPTLTIQPLVENAIKHGVGLHPNGGKVTIRTLRTADDLVVIEVSDTGSGMGAEAAPGAAVGLANVRRRMALHYGEQATVETRFRPDGSVVTISFPWQPSHFRGKMFVGVSPTASSNPAPGA
ncbi:MAG: histidine kinase [Bdellovibrionales bacterium]|nr:histidine kinase [Bdellovibrionales bacterium]